MDYAYNRIASDQSSGMREIVSFLTKNELKLDAL